jgi:hypothetical protein
MMEKEIWKERGCIDESSEARISGFSWSACYDYL